MRTRNLSDAARRVLDGKNFATIATVNPDGSPKSSVVWVAREGDAVLFSSRRAQQKVRNLERDPRVSVSIFDANNPYYSLEIRGRAEVIEDPGRELPKRLSQKYLGQDPPPESGASRVILRVIPEEVTEFSAEERR